MIGEISYQLTVINEQLVNSYWELGEINEQLSISSEQLSVIQEQVIGEVRIQNSEVGISIKESPIFFLNTVP